MSILQDHPAVKVLASFFVAMNEWGWEMARHYRSLEGSDVDEELLARDQHLQRKRAEAIFEQYVEAGTKSLRLQDVGISFTNPPEYDPELESIVSIAKHGEAIDVVTKQSRIKDHYFKYRIVERSGVWLLRDKKYSFDAGKTWRKGFL